MFTTRALVSVAETDQPSIDVRLAGNAIEVRSASTHLSGIKVYDLLGRMIGSATLEPGQRISRTDLGTLPRIVIVVVQHSHGCITQKLLVRD